MKSVIATLIAAFAVSSAFAADAKKEEKKDAPKAEAKKDDKAKKVILARKPPLSKLLNIDLDEDYIITFDDAIARNKNRLQVVEEERLSDYVLFRLWLGRQLALRKYEEAHA